MNSVGNGVPKIIPPPVVLSLTRYSVSPGPSRKEQYRLGHRDLLATSLETLERKIRDQGVGVAAELKFRPTSARCGPPCDGRLTPDARSQNIT